MHDGKVFSIKKITNTLNTLLMHINHNRKSIIYESYSHIYPQVEQRQFLLNFKLVTSY